MNSLFHTNMKILFLCLFVLLFLCLFVLLALAVASKSLDKYDIVRHVMLNLENMKYCIGDDAGNCIQRNMNNIFMYPSGGIVFISMFMMIFFMIAIITFASAA